METIRIIVTGLSSYLLLILVFQLIDILNLKKQNLKEKNTISQSSKPKKSSQNPIQTPSIMGKTKAISRQNKTRLDSSRQPGVQTVETAKKQLTFASEAEITAPEQVEYEVDLPTDESLENPPEIDCFEQDEATEVPCGVLNRELAQLNSLVRKEKLNDSDSQAALNIVEKVDQTEFFEHLITQFQAGKGKQLLTGLREKIKERELSTLKQVQTDKNEISTSTSTMSDQELENYL